jgi:heat shock protein HslJ
MLDNDRRSLKKMNINRTMLGLAFLVVLGMLLAACAPTAGTDAADSDSGKQIAQPDSVERTIYVGPLLVDCQGEGPQKCMLVKEKPEDEYMLFYDQIDGFVYEEGYEYKLIVKEEQVENPPAGGSSLRYSLVSVEYKEPVPIAGEGVEKTVFVAPELVDCTGVAPQKCMLVKHNPEDEYTLFYDQIEGFKYEEGYEYELVILEEQVEDPPADASSISWILVREVSKEPVVDSGEVQLEGIDWVMVSYLNQEGELTAAMPGSNATALFQDGQVNGYASCNGYFGGYEVDGSNLIVSPLASTEMFCGSPPGLMDQEFAYLSALGSAATYSIEDEQLVIANEAGETVLVYAVAEPKSLTGNLWQVISYNNGREAVVSVVIGTGMSAFFEEEGQLSGSAGCNNYTTEYVVEDNNISIGPAATTRMLCSEPDGIMEQEMEYLAALEMAASYEFEDDRLLLLDAEGRRVVNYQLARTFELTETIWHLQNFSDGNETVQSALEGTEITAYFDEEGIISGSAGCNNYTGIYQVDGENIQIELGPLTMMFCDQPEGVMDQEEAYLQALDSATGFQIVGDVMIMLDESGQEVLRFKASDLVGYVWMWIEFLENNDTITRPDMPGNYTLEFLPDGVLNVQADCNNAMGTYTVNGNQLDMEIQATTLAACPPESLSDEYLQLLNDAVAYIREAEFLFIDIMLDTGTMKFFPQ